jgi:hypothetical protein
MNPETNQQPNLVESSSVTSENIHPVNQITPLSKYLAMVLFIMLPFLGGYVGYTLAPEKVVEVENVVITKSDTVDENTQSNADISPDVSEGFYLKDIGTETSPKTEIYYVRSGEPLFLGYSAGCSKITSTDEYHREIDVSKVEILNKNYLNPVSAEYDKADYSIDEIVSCFWGGAGDLFVVIDSNSVYSQTEHKPYRIIMHQPFEEMLGSGAWQQVATFGLSHTFLSSPLEIMQLLTDEGASPNIIDRYRTLLIGLYK